MVRFISLWNSLPKHDHMIETYKILTEKYDRAAVLTLVQACTYVTTRINLRLQKTCFRYDVRKYCFTDRDVNTCNSLPNWVISANMTNALKSRWNKFCRIWKLFMILELSLKELEVVVLYRV